MKLIVAEKENKVFVGGIAAISNLVGTYPNKITNCIKDCDRLVLINGYKIFLDTKFFKSTRKKRK